jgi:LPXTG-motif cell wall-anchored protein
MNEYFLAAPLWVGAIAFVAAGLITRKRQKDI